MFYFIVNPFGVYNPERVIADTSKEKNSRKTRKTIETLLGL